MNHAVDKERELLQNELIKVTKQISSATSVIENQRVEILKLNRIVEEASYEKLRQKQEFNAIRNEKNVLTLQIIQRNQELAKTYNNIKLQHSNIRIGEKRWVSFHLFHVNQM